MKQTIIEQAFKEFAQYGFKSFTMDDLANKLGMSKKTLYEYFPSKNDLVENCLEFALDMTCRKVDFFTEGNGSIIENVFDNQRNIQNTFMISSARPIWELQKYYSKLFEQMQDEFIQADYRFVEKIFEKGKKEGLVREDINLEFYKRFYSNVQRLRSVYNAFPETEFSFWETIYTTTEYLFRVIVNEKGYQELERVLMNYKNK
ncbi:MAG: TetR/AcrR family transcriptional regulator [Capnocytophaga sp.]|nr:TetR/AcrR family transcriptional regulator [Capnocytophaga sp.]